MFTSEQIQSYARVIIYWIAGFAVNHGFANSNDSMMVAGAVVTALNFGWTIWGNRVVAKINELAKQGVVDAIVVKDPEVAKAAPSDKVMSK